MSQRANILEELKELGSSLAGEPVKPVFSVPDGYFEELVEVVLNKIRAQEAENSESLPAGLANISREMPYEIPPGYFAELSNRILAIVKQDRSVHDEITELSPLLAGIKKQMPYELPAGYFETIGSEKKVETARVVSITARRWFKFAAAAVVPGMIFLAGLLYFNSRPDPVKDPHGFVVKKMKHVPTQELDEFVKLAEEEELASNGSMPVKTDEIKELMKDVSDKELQDFLNETPDPGSVEEMMMN